MGYSFSRAYTVGVSDGCRSGGLWDSADQVHLDRGLQRQLVATPPPNLVHHLTCNTTKAAICKPSSIGLKLRQIKCTSYFAITTNPKQLHPTWPVIHTILEECSRLFF